VLRRRSDVDAGGDERGSAPSVVRELPASPVFPHTGKPRRGLVLGGGGVLGAAWMIGALQALEAERGFDPRSVDVVLGTSAGSVLAGLIGSGLDTPTLLHHQLGMPLDGDLQVEFDYDSQSALPPRPRLRLGSHRLLATAARHPRQVRFLPALAALAPQGRGSVTEIGELISDVSGPQWPGQPQTWVVALDYLTGQRTIFGRDGAPEATLSDAVMASCAIPGWFTPVQIGGHPYVDGGAYSSTSLDLLASLGLDEVYCLAPMATLEPDKATGVLGRIERSVRRVVTKQLIREGELVQATGTTVTLIAPGTEDLEAIGLNMMDSARRELVLETALRTTAEVLGGKRQPRLVPAT
jgi:NTE family protein